MDEDYAGPEPIPVVHSTGDANEDGEIRNLVLSAVNTAADALEAVEAAEEKCEERLEVRIAKPLRSLTLLGHAFIDMEPKVDTLEEKLNALEEKLDKQLAELKKELKAELETEQAHLKEQVMEELREEFQATLDKHLAEFNKAQLGQGQVTGLGSTPPTPTSTPGKRGSTSSESGLSKKSKLESMSFDFIRKKK